MYLKSEKDKAAVGPGKYGGTYGAGSDATGSYGRENVGADGESKQKDDANAAGTLLSLAGKFFS